MTHVNWIKKTHVVISMLIK